jgi:hypothetical protein
LTFRKFEAYVILKHSKRQVSQAIPQIPAGLSRPDPLTTIHQDVCCLLAPEELRDSQRIWSSIKPRPTDAFEPDLVSRLSSFNNSPSAWHQFLNPAQVSGPGHYGRIIKYAIIKLNLARQARQCIALAFDLISVQMAIHNCHIDSRFAQTKSEFAAYEVPSELHGEFVTKLRSDVQIPHNLSLRPERRLGAEAAT